MEDLYTRAVLGHLVSDYLLQPKEMAIKKGVSHEWCFVHCLIYTICVCLFMWNFKLRIMLAVFLSHYPIDRYSLGEKWLKMIKGRNLVDEWKAEDKHGLKPVHISFASIVYVVVDNTLHFLLLWFITIFIKRGRI